MTKPITNEVEQQKKEVLDSQIEAAIDAFAEVLPGLKDAHEDVRAERLYNVWISAHSDEVMELLVDIAQARLTGEGTS